jgi:hypothetical protein
VALSDRLAKRFRNVPGVTSTDISYWIAEAEAESGYTADNPEDDKNNALLYLALSIGFHVIATDAARYFKYSDADESVDKTGIAEQYIKLSKDARRQYVRELRGGFAGQTHAKRADGR